jgi:hypothetical protein
MLKNLHRKTLLTIILFGAKKYRTKFIFYFSPKVNNITSIFLKKIRKILHQLFYFLCYS